MRCENELIFHAIFGMLGDMVATLPPDFHDTFREFITSSWAKQAFTMIGHDDPIIDYFKGVF